MSVTGRVDVKLLHDTYELSRFDLYKRQETDQKEEEMVQTQTVTSQHVAEHIHRCYIPKVILMVGKFHIFSHFSI